MSRVTCHADIFTVTHYTLHCHTLHFQICAKNGQNLQKKNSRSRWRPYPFIHSPSFQISQTHRQHDPRLGGDGGLPGQLGAGGRGRGEEEAGAAAEGRGLAGGGGRGRQCEELRARQARVQAEDREDGVGRGRGGAEEGGAAPPARAAAAPAPASTSRPAADQPDPASIQQQQRYPAQTHGR